MKLASLIGKKGIRLRILLGLLLTVIMTFGTVLTASATTYSLKAYYPGEYNATTGVPANGLDAVTIQFTCSDGYGDRPVTFTSSPNTLQLTNANGLKTGYGGSVSFPLTSTVAGDFTITAQYCKLDGTPVGGATASCTVKFSKLPDPTVTLTAFNTIHTPNGTSLIVASVKRDGWGVPNVPVTFTTDGGNLKHLGTLSPTTPQYTNSNGEATVYLSMPVQDTARVTGTLSAAYGSVSNYCIVTFSDGDGGDNPGTYYHVYYNGNGNTGGSVPIDGNNYTLHQWVYVLGNTGGLYRAGYSFAGWTINSDGSGTTYNAGDKYTMGAGNVTFYAKWTANPVAVTYAPNGGTVTPTIQTKLFGSTYGKGANGTTSDAMPIPTWTGHTFNGWFNSSGSLITNDTTVTNPSPHTLTAQWTLIPTYTVTYDGNGATGTVPVDSTSYYQNESVTVLGQGGLNNPGYTFAGWKHPDGPIYQENGQFTMGTSDVTLTAQWTKNPTIHWTVTFDGQGGSPDISTTQVRDGDPVTPPDKPTRSAYDFGGWYPDTNYVTLFDFNTPITKDITLYARWTSTNPGGESFPIFSATPSFFEQFESCWF